MIRRIAWLARRSEKKKDGFDDFLQDTYMRIAEGALHEDPLDPSRPLPPKRTQKQTQKRAVAPTIREVARPAQMTLDDYAQTPSKKSEQTLGCSECRYSARGCARCRNPDFKGYRGPRPAESGAP